MSEMVNDEMVIELIGDLAVEVAPYEMSIFWGDRDAYLADPEAVLQGARHEIRQYQQAGAITLLVPVIRTILIDLFGVIASALDESDSSDEVVRVLTSFRSAPKSWVRDWLPYVRQFTFEKAQAHNVSTSRAHLLADAFVKNLAALST